MISSVLSGGGMTGLPDMANGGTGSGDFAHPVYLAAASDPLVTLGLVAEWSWHFGFADSYSRLRHDPPPPAMPTWA